MSRCTDCGTRKESVEYISVRRFAGGNYRRPSRFMRTTICKPCGEQIFESAKKRIEEGCRVGLVGDRISSSSLENALGKQLPKEKKS